MPEANGINESKDAKENGSKDQEDGNGWSSKDTVERKVIFDNI
jgi:hypothetical protein